MCSRANGIRFIVSGLHVHLAAERGVVSPDDGSEPDSSNLSSGLVPLDSNVVISLFNATSLLSSTGKCVSLAALIQLPSNKTP